jgi:hypothetical protein
MYRVPAAQYAHQRRPFGLTDWSALSIQPIHDTHARAGPVERVRYGQQTTPFVYDCTTGASRHSHYLNLRLAWSF